MENFASAKSKLGYVYVLILSGMAEKAAILTIFLHRKIDEDAALKAEIESLKSEVKNWP